MPRILHSVSVPLSKGESVLKIGNTSGGSSGYTTVMQFEEAIVMNVITNDNKQDNPKYNDLADNIGMIEFKALTSGLHLGNDRLPIAFPLDSNIRKYPLINEIVLVYSILGAYYYTAPINTMNKSTMNYVPGLAKELTTATRDSSQHLQDARQGNPQVINRDPTSTATGDPAPGAYYRESNRVYKLRHGEGDLVIEGRAGHSIRFGLHTANLSPNIIIRAGQAPQAAGLKRQAVINENINHDKSSIWLVTDQTVPLTFATQDNVVHMKSMVEKYPAGLQGNQIIVNSNRIVLNAKTDTIMGSSNSGIHWMTNRDFTVDTNRDYLSWVTRNSDIIIGNNNYIHTGNDYGLTINRDSFSTVQRNSQVFIGGDSLLSIAGNADYRFTSNLFEAVNGNRQLHTAGTFTNTVAGNFINSAQSITLNAAVSLNLSTQGTFLISTSNMMAFAARQLSLGSNRANRPVVLGDKLVQEILMPLLQILITAKSGAIPASPALFATDIARISQLIPKVQRILSTKVFVE